MQINYDSTANPTIDEFHGDDSFVRAIMGPVGSGKSVGCCMEIILRANQAPKLKASNVRPFKAIIVRNTLAQLRDTTEATFFDWIPPEIGEWKASEHQFKATWPHPSGDGTMVELEVLFRGLDTPKDARKLLSLEATLFFFNEAREIPWNVIELAQTRVGRFPPANSTVTPGWFGIILDTNGPDTDSKFYKTFEEIRPAGHKIFKQPSGLSDRAENLHNLVPNYYQRLCAGKHPDWIKVYAEGDYGFYSDGKPIFPEYQDNLHCQKEVVPYVPGEPIYVGCDWGLTPAAVYAQRHAGVTYVIAETVTENLGAVNFVKEVSRMLRGPFSKSEVFAWGDPAGDQRSALRENETVFKIVRQAGLPIDKAPSQDPVVRREAVAKLLASLNIQGIPNLVISPKCKFLRKGLRGGYCYKRLQVAGGERFQEKPDKNIYSHVCEALEYMLVGMGEGYNLVETQSGSVVRRPKVQGALG